jgi:thymidylate synthase ThyX
VAYSAKILADSISEAGDRLTTMEVTFPRMVLAEYNTHRVFSRNSASSRAIPVLKQLMRIEENPFIPIYWGKNQSGMSAKEEISTSDKKKAIAIWLAARDDAVEHCKALLDLGVHKQIANRLLEPFMWHTVVVTATEWSNFFALRAHEDAQPEIRVIAEMMQDIYKKSEPQLLREDEWHLPLIQPEEYDGVFEFSEEARKISAARCARVSYLTHDGRRDLEADLTLYERLVSGGHMSPLEHVATPVWHELEIGDSPTEFIYRKFSGEYQHGEFIGNFRGWKQFRKFHANEQDFSRVRKTRK